MSAFQPGTRRFPLTRKLRLKVRWIKRIGKDDSNQLAQILLSLPAQLPVSVPTRAEFAAQ